MRKTIKRRIMAIIVLLLAFTTTDAQAFVGRFRITGPFRHLEAKSGSLNGSMERPPFIWVQAHSASRVERTPLCS